MKPLSRNDLMLMGLLLERPMHGYELSEILSGPGLGEWARLGRTSVYYALGRLERDELVTKHIERHGDMPERSVYSITDTGREAFFETLETTLRVAEDPMTEFDVALYYSSRLHRDTAQAAIKERVRNLAQDIDKVAQLADRAAEERDLPLRLVMERRLAVLEANRAYLEAHLGKIAEDEFESEMGSFKGSLADTMLHEVLKTVSSAKRSGVVWVSIDAATVGFAVQRGTLYGYFPDPRIGDPGSLEVAFTSTGGTFEFNPSDGVFHDSVELPGLEQAILRGARGVSASTAFERLIPDPQTLLVISEGLRAHSLTLDLTDVERGFLEVLDGVKTVSEISKRLGIDEEQVVRTAFPLWALGWVVRLGREKRDLVLAVTAYARRWMDAVELFAGREACDRVSDIVGSGSCSLDGIGFPLDTREIAGFDFHLNRGALAVAACDFTECLLSAVRSVLGEAFVSDVMNGYAAQLPAAQAEILVKSSAVVEDARSALEARLEETPKRGRRR